MNFPAEKETTGVVRTFVALFDILTGMLFRL
jgi:hypothetical protein